MPELIVIALAAVAFVAIGARFLPRNEGGQVQLPAIVDQSVGMWMLRRMLGREPDAALSGDAPSLPEPADDEAARIAHRIGVPGAPAPTHPTRFVVSHAPPQAHPLPRPVPVTPVTAFDPVRWRAQARPRAALAVQRRIAGVLAIGVVAVTMLAVTMLPRGAAGEVLSATGTPGLSNDAAVATPPPTEPPLSTGASATAEASLPPDASAPPLVPVQTPPRGTAIPTATSTPRATATPTRTPSSPPTPGPSSSVKPSPTASTSPSPTPTDSPTPTPTDSPSPTPSPPSESPS